MRNNSKFVAMLVVAGLSWIAAALPAGARAEPPAPAEPKLYNEAADAREQIAAAVAAAKRENQRVLVQWGGNWCPWCIRLHELFGEDPQVKRKLVNEYQVVYVDTGRPNRKNIDLAQSFGADVLTGGFPYLTVLDADGKPIANQETGSLEAKSENGESAGVKAGHDSGAVLKFLDEHKAPALNAEEVLSSALAEAKSSGRRVFLHFGAPWCGWCKRLEAWMQRPEVAPVIGKEFVDVKIDVDRMTGGAEVFARYNANSKRSGIPWVAFLNENGEAVADSAMEPEGANMGFPASPEEIRHFGAMLKKGAKHLTDADLAALLATLEAKPQAGASR